MSAIARKEIASNLLSYKFFIVIILTVILIFTSFFIMYRDFNERLADYDIIKPTATAIAVLDNFAMPVVKSTSRGGK